MKTTKLSDVLNDNLPNWNDWTWQMQQKSVCSNPTQLSSLGLLTSGANVSKRKIGLTPYNVKLLLDLKDSDVEAYQAESLQSLLGNEEEYKDHQWVWAKKKNNLIEKLLNFLPIPRFLKTLFTGKGSDTEVRGLENMYPKTDVLIATASCARHCSFCFREVGDPQGEAAKLSGGMETVLNAVKAIINRKTPHVLVTGGDPLTRNNKQLYQILTPLVESQTVEVLRLATRLVVDLPMRFYDQELLEMLSNFAKQMKERNAVLRLVTQINHPCELTPAAMLAIRNIQSCGIEIMNQTVVLKGVNDNPTVLGNIFMILDRLGIRNHKIFQAMPVAGTDNLRIPLRKFRQLIASLHQWLPGTAVPQANVATLVGKVPIYPSGRWTISIPFSNRFICRSFKGEWYLFRDTWDMIRHLREAAALIVVIILFVVLSPGRFKPIVANSAEIITVSRIAILPNEMDYPDYFARRPFIPFVDNHTLYVPWNFN